MKTSLEFSSFGGASVRAGSPVCFLSNGPAPAYRRGQGRRAFTLIELLAVIAVIITLIGLAGPSVRGWRDSHIRSATAGTLTALLTEARTAALTQGRPSYLILSDHPGLASGAIDPRPADTPGSRWRYFAIYQQQTDPELPPTALTRWYRLPDGCELVSAEDRPSLLCAPAEDRHPLFPSPPAEDEERQPYLAFNANGGVQHPASSSHARLWLRTASDQTPGQISVALFTGRPTCQW